MGYFAWPNKTVGDLSHYGENALLMLQSLVAEKGEFKASDFQEKFVKHFGYGGTYVGYIDTPTRETLDNIAAQARAAADQAKALPYAGSAQDRHLMLVECIERRRRRSELLA
jgi:hypothetical protein